MHDDDDPDKPMGKVHQSGIDPHAARAEYSLPDGYAALEGGVAEYPVPEAASPVTRRHWIALGLASLGVGYFAGAFCFRDAHAAEPERVREPRDDEFLRSARRVAQGPIADLVYSRETFLMVLESRNGEDLELWQGMERLTDYAILDRSESGFAIAKRLLESLEINPPPARLGHMRLRLEQFIVEFEGK